MEVTVTLTTRGRYFTTLPLCLMSIYNQTALPKKVILVDDNEKKEFQQLDIFKNILFLFKQKNIEFEYLCGESRGQVYAQQKALDKVKTDLVLKLDDDNILENDVLEELLMLSFSKQTGAVSCLILTDKDLNRKLDCDPEDSLDTFNKIEDIYSSFNIQMIKNQDRFVKLVEHLHSCYLFRRNATNGYPLEFAPSGHREDTVFTHQIFRDGYSLYVNPSAVIWHLKDETGGNRLHNDGNKNELLFIEKLKEWKIIPDRLQLITENNITYVVKGNTKFVVPV